MAECSARYRERRRALRDGCVLQRSASHLFAPAFIAGMAPQHKAAVQAAVEQLTSIKPLIEPASLKVWRDKLAAK